MEVVKEQYEQFLAKLERCLTMTGVDSCDLKKTIKLYKGSSTILPEFESADSLNRLLHEISQHSSWFNYNLLELLIQLLNHQEGLDLLLQYENEYLHPFLDGHLLTDIPAKSFASHCGDTTASYVHCILMANLAGLSGRDAIIITRRLAEALHIPSLQLLERFENLRLIFGIHSEVFRNAITQEGSLLQAYLEWNKEEVYVIKIDITVLMPKHEKVSQKDQKQHFSFASKSQAGNLKSSIDMLDRVIQDYTPSGAQYSLWLDRQVRPTIGVSAHRGRSRREVGPMFSEMLQALTDFYQKEMPDNMADVHFVYSIGSWQRSRNFHIKTHLLTPTFLMLTDKLCAQNSLGCNMFHNVRDELEKRQKNHHHGLKLQRLFETDEHTVVHSAGSYRVVLASGLDYPMVFLYQTAQDRANKSISATDLPQALEVLETFVTKEWCQDGFSINMIIATGVAALSPCYHVAAVIEESVFALRAGKDVSAVKAAWDRGITKRRYHSKNS